MNHYSSSVYNSQSQKITVSVVVDSVAPKRTKKSKFSNTAKEPSNAHRLILDHNVGHGVKSVAANIGQFEKPASSPAKTHAVPRKRDAVSTSQNHGTKHKTQGISVYFSALRAQARLSATREISSKEALRTKHCQFEGPSPFSAVEVGSQTLDASTHQMMLKQNSDTIVTDSESFSLATRRPVTRSLARNKPPTGHPTTNFKPTSVSREEVKQCNSITSSANKPMPSQSCAVSRGCLTIEDTDSAKKSCGAKPGDLLLPLTGLKNIQPAAIVNETSSHENKLPLQSVTRTLPSHGCLNENIVVHDSENPVLKEISEHHESFGFQTAAAPQVDHDDCSDRSLFNVVQGVKEVDAIIGQFEKPTSSPAKTHSVQTARNEALLKNVVARKRDAATPASTSQKNGNMSRAHARSEYFSAVCNLKVPKELQEQTSGVEISSKEAPRTKRCQFFGPSPLSYVEVGCQQTLEASTHQMMPEQNAKVDCHSKLRQNSDAIETDSVNVSLTTKRPSASSLTKYKTPTAQRTRNFKPKSLSLDKETKQCNSISSSAKKPMTSQSCAVSRGCLTTEHTDGAKKNCGTKSGDLLLHSTGLKNIQPEATGDETSRPAKELPLQEDHDDCSDCPLFKMTGFILNSSPPHGSPPKAGSSIVEDKCLTMSSSATENNNNSGSSDSKATPDERYSSANDTFIEEENADDGLFTTCKGETDSTEEVSSMKRAYMDVQTSSEIELADKPIVFWNKQHRSQEVDIDDVSPVFTIPIAGGKPDDIFLEASQENADTGLTSEISNLRLAVEQAKMKMALATNRTCLDILMSTTEEISSDLQDVESQIQADARKLMRHVTSKRKQLQTRLEEKQELLKVTHENYKRAIYKCPQDYKVAVEGAEAQLVELKGAMESQKVSERLLVAKGEAAVEKHITNAHRKIKACMRRQEKMQQLKVAIG